MPRYIDADALLERLTKKKSEVAKARYTEGFNDAISRVRSMLSSASTENVASIRESEWISVKDRLPQDFVSVLGYMTDAGDFPPVRECYKVGGVFFFPALGDRHPISHWMPLPEPPKGE